MKEIILSLEEAAVYLGISRACLLSLKRCGYKPSIYKFSLPYIEEADTLKYRLSDLDNFLNRLQRKETNYEEYKQTPRYIQRQPH